jgi:hypothetical protein
MRSAIDHGSKRTRFIIFSWQVTDDARKKALVKIGLAGEIGPLDVNSRRWQEDIATVIVACCSGFSISLNATISSKKKVSRECCFFSHVFKGLTAEGLITS